MLYDQFTHSSIVHCSFSLSCCRQLRRKKNWEASRITNTWNFTPGKNNGRKRCDRIYPLMQLVLFSYVKLGDTILTLIRPKKDSIIFISMPTKICTEKLKKALWLLKEWNRNIKLLHVNWIWKTRGGGGEGGKGTPLIRKGRLLHPTFCIVFWQKKGTPFVHRFLDKNRYPFHLSRTLHPFYKPLMKLMNNITGEHAW